MTHSKIALFTSLILWIFFFLAVFFIPLPVPIEEEKEFGEVAIRLDPLSERVATLPPAIIESASIEETATSSQNTAVATSSVPAEVPAPRKTTATPVAPTKSNTPTPVAPTKSNTPAPVEPAKPNTPAPVKPAKSNTPTPATPVPQQTLAKSTEELIAEQAATSQDRPDAVWDDSLFADNASTSTSTSTSTSSSVSNNSPNNQNRTSSSLSGSAASANTNASSDKIVTEGNTAGQSSNANDTASADTIVALENIGAIGDGSRGMPSSSESGANLAAASGSALGNPSGFDINFEGESRRLIRPAVPTLTISPENQRLIDSSRQLTVSFNVSASGNVSNIVFTPSALLPPVIQSELRVQISQWQFSPGSGSGQARFIYSINKG